jgi:hypothetical protein
MQRALACRRASSLSYLKPHIAATKADAAAAPLAGTRHAPPQANAAQALRSLAWRPARLG